jgi:hypothetical protein
MSQLSNKKEHQAQAFILKYLWLLLCGIATVLYVFWFLKCSSHGVDFTDESFYLIWISDPFLYGASTTQFGFIYHPFYLLFDGDVVRLRQFNILITFFPAWALTFVLMKKLAPIASLQRAALLIVSAGFSASALIAFDIGVVTPSYNSLAFQALLITVTGLLLTEKLPTPANLFGSILIGVGGWLAFMAKPTTAIMLALGLLFYFALSRKLNLRTIVISTACALVALLASALLIDGSVTGFIERLRTGVEFTAYLGAGHSLNQMVRLDSFYFNSYEKVVFLVLTALACFSTRFDCSKTGPWRLITWGLLLVSFCASLALAFIFYTKPYLLGNFKGLLLLSVTFSCGLIALQALKQNFFAALSTPHWIMMFFFLVLPHIYAFGTNGNYWTAGASAGLFWVLAGLVMLGPLARTQNSWQFALPLVFLTLAISSALVYTGMERPYRQPGPLRLNTQTVEFGAVGSDLVLADSFAAYIQSAVTIATRAGFQPGTAVIDFTGQSPGIVYAIKGKSPGQPWMIGGYPGSEGRALAALRRVSCEKLAGAWLLIEPDGPRSLKTDILSSLGSHFPEDFQSVGKWETSAREGVNPPTREQYLFKPTRSSDEAVAACVAAKSNYRDEAQRD